MTYPLPSAYSTGSLQAGDPWGLPGLTVWVITFPPENTDRYISRMWLMPPAGIVASTSLTVWDDSGIVTVAPNATSTEYQPLRTIRLAAGSALYVVYGTSSGSTPQGKVYFEGNIFG